MERFSEILAEAASAIKRNYFYLDVYRGKTTYRERVYCYELYHQLRSRWPEEAEFILNGEVDKRNSPSFIELNEGFPKPDLLVHMPGTNNNHAILEVKHSYSLRGVRKDLNVLNTFVNKLGYKRAIYLIYGSKAESIAKRTRSLGNELFEKFPSWIELWIHTEVEEPAKKVY